jgi:glycosyltransferase involved in cell wall biosynthesis
MLTAIIATHESERALVPTLAALVPGATAGLIKEAIIADGGSRDATAEVADYAGCRFMSSQDPLGARLRAAAETARTPWLMFLRAGCVPEPGWVGAVERFMAAADEGRARGAAVFRPGGMLDVLRPGLAEFLGLLRIAFGGGRSPDQGLLIASEFYRRLGGHPDGADAEAAMLRRLGRRHIAMLAAGARPPR